ncbi:MAG: hypothetical protein R3E88_11175 [Myxococcota bacterium]
MLAFRVHLALVFGVLAVYTAVVVDAHGLGLLPVFFGDIAKMEWPGQFDLDFTGFLSLSALWLAWRHRFTPGGFALGALGFFGGSLFLSAYLLWASLAARGDVAVLLLGDERARR